MIAVRFSARCTVLLVVLICIHATAGLALAGAPLVTDDAGIVDVGKLELELNNSYNFENKDTSSAKLDRDTADTEVKISTGLYKNLGIALLIPYTFSNRERIDGNLSSSTEGFGDMTLELKYAFAEPGGINLAIKPTILMPTGKYSNGQSEGRWQFGAVLIATKEFDDGNYALHANLGYEHHDYRTDEIKAASRSELWKASLAGEIKIIRGLFAMADVGLATTTDTSTRELSAYALTGVRYDLNDYLGINAGIKAGLTKPEDDISLLYGLLFKF